MIAKEALMLLENSLTFTKYVNRRYAGEFAQTGAKIGATVNIRVPPQFSVTSGPNLSIQNFTETIVPLTIYQQNHVDVSFSSVELTLSIQDFSDRVLKPQIAQLANRIDQDGLAQYVNVYNSVGVPGTPNTTLAPFLQAGVILDNNATPRDNNLRNIVLSPQGQADAVSGFNAYFPAPDTIGKQYLNGTMGRALGFKWSMDQNVNTLTVGPLGGSPAVNGASQTGSTLVTNGWTASAASRLLGGETFTLPNVYALNPLSKFNVGGLRGGAGRGPGAAGGAGGAARAGAPAGGAGGPARGGAGAPAGA